LLSSDIPTVRYRTMTELLGMDEEEGEVQAAREAIMSSGPVPKILERQRTGGFWGESDRFYRDKYKGTVWTLILLAELRADPEDQQVKDACEFIIRSSQHRESGGFSDRGDASKGGGVGVMSCLTGNMAYSLVRLGYADDERVRKAMSWIAKYQRFETQPPPSKDWPYRFERCWCPRDCRSGAVKSLKALSSLSMHRRTEDVKQSMRRGSEFLLEQCLNGGGNGLRATARKEWFLLGHPHMYDTDLLEIVRVLIDSGVGDSRMDEAVRFIRSRRNSDGTHMYDTDLLEIVRVLIDSGVGDSRMDEAVRFIRSRRNSDGRWLQGGSRSSEKYLVRLERKGEESRFVTLEALLAMANYGI